MSKVTLNISLNTEKIDELIKNELINFESGKCGSVDEAKQQLRDSILNNIKEFIVIETRKPTECEAVDLVKMSDVIMDHLRFEARRKEPSTIVEDEIIQMEGICDDNPTILLAHDPEEFDL